MLFQCFCSVVNSRSLSPLFDISHRLLFHHSHHHPLLSTNKSHILLFGRGDSVFCVDSRWLVYRNRRQHARVFRVRYNAGKGLECLFLHVTDDSLSHLRSLSLPLLQLLRLPQHGVSIRNVTNRFLYATTLFQQTFPVEGVVLLSCDGQNLPVTHPLKSNIGGCSCVKGREDGKKGRCLGIP